VDPFSKEARSENPISISLNFTDWIKLMFDPVDFCNFVINESMETETGFCEIVVRVKSHFKMRVIVTGFTVASVPKVSEVMK